MKSKRPHQYKEGEEIPESELCKADQCVVCNQEIITKAGYGDFEEWCDAEQWEMVALCGKEYLRHTRCPVPDLTNIQAVDVQTTQEDPVYKIVRQWHFAPIKQRPSIIRPIPGRIEAGDVKWFKLVSVVENVNANPIYYTVFYRPATDKECARQRREQDKLKKFENTVFACDNCSNEVKGSELGDDSDIEPLYECGGCGNRFVGESRCEDCNRFAAKISDYGCPSCEGGELIQQELPEKDKKV